MGKLKNPQYDGTRGNGYQPRDYVDEPIDAELERKASRAAIFTGLGISLILVLIAVAVLGCSTTYDACDDPKSAIVFLPEQCHAGFNRAPEWFEQ
ncbi:MAG: hypothetical protein ACR2Q3_01675 [Woeseiaceae bacterium]